VLAVVGFDSLAAYAADRPADGVTVVQMAGELGRSDVWLARRGGSRGGLGDLIGKPGRARVDPDQLARGLGVTGLAAYARQRTAAGVTVQAMAAELGHSDTWLARHLRDTGLGGLIGRPGPAR